jgi:hypothetical protein
VRLRNGYSRAIGRAAVRESSGRVHRPLIAKLADPDSSCVTSSGTSIAKTYGGPMRYGHSAQAPTLAKMSQALRSLVLFGGESTFRPIPWIVAYLRVFVWGRFRCRRGTCTPDKAQEQPGSSFVRRSVTTTFTVFYFDAGCGKQTCNVPLTTELVSCP